MPRAACVAFFALSLSLEAPRSQELVLQKEGTQQYHRPGCPIVGDGRGVLAMTRGQADARGLKPHAGCDPAEAKPDPSAAGEQRGTGSTGGRSATPVFVFVDAAKEPSVERGKLYHREHCPALGKERRKLSVGDAAKHFWPCPKCRPPIRKRK
jgi:hypothetical protein